MFLRKLTDEELEKIKKAKASIKEQRQDLQGAIKKQRKRIQEETKRLKIIKEKDRNVDMYQPLKILQDHLSDLGNQFNALPIIIGLPVIIKIEDETLCMDYELLKKFDRSLDKSAFWNPDIRIQEKSLIIRYQKFPSKGTAAGAVELYALPPYQVELLEGLPIMDLRDIEFEELLA